MTFSHLLLQLLIDSLLTGSFPSVFKSAVVRPVFKKIKKISLDTDNLRNYRPVSNLPFLSNISEKIVLLQLSQHRESNSLLYPLQSAYRLGHNTETALLKIVNDLLAALDVSHISLLSLLTYPPLLTLSTTPFYSPDSIIILPFLALLCLGFSHTSLIELRLYLSKVLPPLLRPLTSVSPRGQCLVLFYLSSTPILFLK